MAWRERREGESQRREARESKARSDGGEREGKRNNK